jgi:hypothetical protein
MNDEDLRDFFAAFAMFAMAWHRGDEEQDARDCFFLADKMLEERAKDKTGIAAIKPRGAKNG